MKKMKLKTKITKALKDRQNYEKIKTIYEKGIYLCIY